MMRWVGPSLLAASVSLACGESRLLDEFANQSTRLRVAPESFRGNVPCLKGAAGALQVYAVSFQQAREVETQPDAGLFFETSAPVPCDRAVFLDAVPGRRYVADIYGFDREVPGPEAPLAEARWLAHCGRGDGDGPPDAGRGGPTFALYGVTSLMGGCTTFSGSGEATRLLIDQASALDGLSCGSQPGQVSRLEGVLDGTRSSARCGDPLIFELASSARFYTVELTAFEANPAASPAGGAGDALDASAPGSATADAAVSDAGQDGGVLDAGGGVAPPPQDAGASDAGLDPGIARWRTQCFGKTLPGVTASATCDPLLALP